MKIIFLDVDGVLNMHNSGGLYALNRNRLRLLQKLVDETGAKIVLSSTWRKDEKGLNKLRSVLKYRGLAIHDVTLDLAEQPNGERAYRGNEIQEWLDRHPEVVNYVILDDDSDMRDSQLRNFVQTDGMIGLTETLVYRAIQILNSGIRKIV